MSRTKNASRNIVWGTLNKIITLLLPFITRTVMIYTLGMNYVGLGSLFSSILQVLSFAELGIGGALVFSMYKPIADGDDIKVSALLNLYKKTYQIIGIVILLMGIAMMPFLDTLIAGDIPFGINLQLLFVAYLVNNIAGYFLFAYKQSLFMASQRMDVISKIGMILQLLLGCTQIIILVTVKNYYLYVTLIPIVTIVNNIILAYLADRAFPQYKCQGDIDRAEKNEIKKKVGGMVFQKIGGIVLSSVDTIVISAFLGLTSLALYQNYLYIITALFSFLMVIMQSIIAGVGNSVASETVEKNFFDFNKLNFIYVWLITWCSTCLLCLYQPFMQIWVGKNNMFGFDMVILFTIYFFIHKWCDILYVYQEACGIWWETRFISLKAALLNLATNIILVQVMGLPGILISTILAVLIFYMPGYSKVLFGTYFKPINRGFRKFWKRQLLYLVSSVIVSAITVFICNLISSTTAIIQLLINGAICVIVPNMFLIILWHKLPEFVHAKSMLNHMVLKAIRR